LFFKLITIGGENKLFKDTKITIVGENESFKDTKIKEESERQLSLLQYSSQIL
jgi:hypothetical protein